jgi:hypothetical protein
VPPPPPQVLFYRAFPLVGEAVPYRLGLERHQYRAPPAARPGGGGGSGGPQQDVCPECRLPAAAGGAGELGASELPGGAPAFDLPPAALRWVPPVVLVSSINDHLVPFHESSEMYWRLLEAGGPPLLPAPGPASRAAADGPRSGSWAQQ